MNPPRDYVIVAADAEFNDRIGQLYVDTTHKPRDHKRIWAEVVAVPERLTSSIVTGQVYTGMPKPTVFLGGNRLMEILKDCKTEAQAEQVRGKYVCSTYEVEMTTMKGEEVETWVGDKAYFHYLSLDDFNYVKRDISKQVNWYRVQYDQIICVVRKVTLIDQAAFEFLRLEGETNETMGLRVAGLSLPELTKLNEMIRVHIGRKAIEKENRLIPLNGNVLVKKYYEAGLEDIDVGTGMVKGRTKMVGNVRLVVSLNEGAKFQEGILTYIGKPVPGKEGRPDVRHGDHIIFSLNSEFENTIEGEEYYVMKQSDIIAVIVEGRVVPVGDYVLLYPDLNYDKEKYKIHDENEVHDPNDKRLYLQEKFIKAPITGDVIATGCLCEEVERGQQVLFSNKNKHSFLYMPGQNILLLREADIMAAETLNQ